MFDNKKLNQIQKQNEYTKEELEAFQNYIWSDKFKYAPLEDKNFVEEEKEEFIKNYRLNKNLGNTQKQNEYKEEEMEPVGIPSSYPFPEPLISKILKNIFVKKK